MVQKHPALLLSLLSVKYFRRSYKTNFWLELFDSKKFKKYCGEKVDLVMKTFTNWLNCPFITEMGSMEINSFIPKISILLP